MRPDERPEGEGLGEAVEFDVDGWRKRVSGAESLEEMVELLKEGRCLPPIYPMDLWQWADALVMATTVEEVRDLMTKGEKPASGVPWGVNPCIDEAEPFDEEAFLLRLTQATTKSEVGDILDGV